MGGFFAGGNRSPARIGDEKRPRRRRSPTASYLPPLGSTPCRHYLLALSSALLSVLGFVGALAAGMGCSFLSVTYADDDSALAPEGEEDGWTYDFGPRAPLDGVMPTRIGVFCNDDGGGKAATLSKAFLSASLALGFLLLLAAGASTFLPASSRLWNGISALSVLTFIAELPTLLLIDGASCRSPGATCRLGASSAPLFASMAAYAVLAVLTQWKERPNWREECQIWRLARESARKRPDGVRRDQTESFDFDEERGVPQVAEEEEYYAVLSDRAPTQPKSEPPKVKRATPGKVEKMNLLSHDELVSTDADAIVILSERNDIHEENRAQLAKILREERSGKAKGAPDEGLATAKAGGESRNEPPLRYVSIEDQSVNRSSVATSDTTLLARGSSPAKASFHAAAAPASPPRGGGATTPPAAKPLGEGSDSVGRPATSPRSGILTPENVSPLSGGSDGAQPPVYESESDSSNLDRFGMDSIDGRRRIRRRSAEEIFEERLRQQKKQQQQQSSTEEVKTTHSGGSDGATRDRPGTGYDTSDLGRFGMEAGKVVHPDGAGAEARSQPSSIDDEANAHESNGTNEGKCMNFDGGNTTTATNDHREASSRQLSTKDTVDPFRQAFDGFDDAFDEAGSSFRGNGEVSLISASFKDEAFGEDVFGDHAAFGANLFRDPGLGGRGGGSGVGCEGRSDLDWTVNDVVSGEKEATANVEQNEANNANVTNKTQRNRKSAASGGIDSAVVGSQRKGKKEQKSSYSLSTAEENSSARGDGRQPVTFSQESIRQMSLATEIAYRAKEGKDLAADNVADKSYERKDESFAYESIASDNSPRQKAKKGQQAPMPQQMNSTKEAAVFQHFDELSVPSSAASNQSSATPSGSKRRLRIKIPSRPPSVFPSSQSFSSASTNRASNKTGSGTASSGKKRGLKKQSSIFRRKSKKVIQVILDDEEEGGKNKTSNPTKTNASPKKARDDKNPTIGIVSPEKDHDPAIVAYPSESEMSELSLTDYHCSSDEHGHAPLIRSSSMGTYSSEDGSSNTDGPNLTESEELSAVIAGVNKKLQHRLTSGKNKPRRRRRKGHRSYSAVSSVSSGYSSHGSLLDEVIVEEGELNSSNEVANTSGNVPSHHTVPVMIEASPKKNQIDQSKSHGGSWSDSGYESKPFDPFVSDSEESLSSRAARARRNRILAKRRQARPPEDPAAIAMRPLLFRPASPPNHPDDESYGMAADRGINDRRLPPAAARTDEDSASVGSNADTAAWRARKVRMARLRKVRQSATAKAKATTTTSTRRDNNGTVADAVVNRATHGGVVLACTSDEDSI